MTKTEQYLQMAEEIQNAKQIQIDGVTYDVRSATRHSKFNLTLGLLEPGKPFSKIIDNPGYGRFPNAKPQITVYNNRLFTLDRSSYTKAIRVVE